MQKSGVLVLYTNEHSSLYNVISLRAVSICVCEYDGATIGCSLFINTPHPGVAVHRS